MNVRSKPRMRLYAIAACALTLVLASSGTLFADWTKQIHKPGGAGAGGMVLYNDSLLVTHSRNGIDEFCIDYFSVTGDSIRAYSIPHSTYSFIHWFQPEPNGSLFIVGCESALGSVYDVMTFRLDPFGVRDSFRFPALPGHSHVGSGCTIFNGGYLLCGLIRTDVSTYFDDAYFLYYYPGRDSFASYSEPRPGYQAITGVSDLHDSLFVAVGSTLDTTLYAPGYGLVSCYKLYTNEILWTTTFVRDIRDYGIELLKPLVYEDCLMIIGVVHQTTPRAWDPRSSWLLVKMSFMGDTIWSREYDFEPYDYPMDACKINDHQFVVCGYTGRQAVYAIFDTNGTMCSSAISTELPGNHWSAVAVKDSALFLFGSASILSSDTTTENILTLSCVDLTSSVESLEGRSLPRSIELCSPFRGILDLRGVFDSLTISDASGREVARAYRCSRWEPYPSLASGLLFLKLFDGKEVVTARTVYLR